MKEKKDPMEQIKGELGRSVAPAMGSSMVRIAWIIAVFASIQFLIFMFVFYKIFSKPFDTAGKMFDTKMDVTQTFIGYTEQQKKVQHLLLVKITRNETNRKEYSFSSPWIMNGKTLSSAKMEVRAPVTYNYYVDMKGPWKIVCENETLTITAPKLQVEEPATDLSRMETRIDSGKLIFDEQAKLEELRRQFYTDMKRKALTPEYVDLVREDARRSLADFANGWIVADILRKYPVKYISVKFEDEEKFPMLKYSVSKY
ncbi:MAG TPA: hypothetical protein DET40_14270 [Lentisphaeria bacterium]|nr:MAG: hypothetical protein A2X45_20965 [Lentisphaerae bacterium GWF2_50_93]HCE44703.1 hypothetical protein [Lentisphaeria bacterium]